MIHLNFLENLERDCFKKLFFEKLKIRVTSSKRRHKNSMKCAIAKFLNQDGRPDRYLKLKRMMENSAKTPPPPSARENTPP